MAETTRVITLTEATPAQIDRVGEIIFACFKTSALSLFHSQNDLDSMRDQHLADARCLVRKGWVDVLIRGLDINDTEGKAASIKPEDILGLIVYYPPGLQRSDITDWTSFSHRLSDEHNGYIANEWKAQKDKMLASMPDNTPMRWVLYIAVDPAYR